MSSARLMATPGYIRLSRLSRNMYEQFLQKAKDKHFEFIQFRDFLSSALPQRFIVLRHDIDFAPQYSLAMAELEQSAGIQSTFFVLTDGQFYDVLAPSHVRCIRRIHDLGHEIGLHFAVSSSVEADIGREVEWRLKTLSDIVGAPVCSFSQHDPVNAGFADVALPASVGPCVDAYKVILDHELLYVSDSAKMWRQHTFETALAEERNLCLLAHPHSWLHPNDDYIGMIREFQEARTVSASEPFDSFVNALAAYYERRLREGV
jgi:hypothetical protein